MELEGDDALGSSGACGGDLLRTGVYDDDVSAGNDDEEDDEDDDDDDDVDVEVEAEVEVAAFLVTMIESGGTSSRLSSDAQHLLVELPMFAQ